MLDATWLEKLLIDEVSGVSDPANETPGWIVMKAARRSSDRLAPEHAQALKLVLSDSEVAKATEIESEAAAEELQRRGVPVAAIRAEYELLAFRQMIGAGRWK